MTEPAGPTPQTILANLEKAVILNSAAEEALKSLLKAMAPPQNGSGLLVPGSAKPKAPELGQILGHIAGSLHALLQGQRISMLAIGTLLEDFSKGRCPACQGDLDALSCPDPWHDEATSAGQDGG